MPPPSYLSLSLLWLSALFQCGHSFLWAVPAHQQRRLRLLHIARTTTPRRNPTERRIMIGQNDDETTATVLSMMARRQVRSGNSGSSVLPNIQVGSEVGSGSYGTVHLIQLLSSDHDKSDDDDNNNNSHARYCIGKRAWSERDLEEPQLEQCSSSSSKAAVVKERALRCRTYWETERHCFQKLQQQQRAAAKNSNPNDRAKNNNNNKGIPKYQATVRDEEGRDWMIFDLITATTTSQDDDDDDTQPALCLQDVMELDRQDHKLDGSHHLVLLARALGVEARPSQSPPTPPPVDDDDDDDAPLEFLASLLWDDDDDDDSAQLLLAATLDKVMLDLLEILKRVHAAGIVHRDIKPSNILVTNGQLYLIDFGSAADLDTAGPLRANIGLSERVAISPIYAAPEVFVDASSQRSAVKFDCFSLALLYCQLLFQYLDERTDAGFHQQLKAADWNLNAWLATEMAGKIRPAGLDSALRVLSLRPGLWTLLQDMLKPDPWDRVDSKTALERYRKIVQESKELGTSTSMVDSAVISAADGPFLADVLESMDFCLLPEDEWPTLTVRPLQFVATFRRKESLGLVLAEVGSVEETDFEDDDDPAAARQLWMSATANAVDGEVFVRGVVKGSQADELGIFHVGDRLQGIGEIPLANQGFDGAVRLLQDETTPDPNYITLHFDRQSYSAVTTASDVASSTMDEESETTLTPMSSTQSAVAEKPIRVSDQGAWSSRGRRASQEDRYLLHELHDEKDERSIFLAGVFDGHLGTAASSTAQTEFPRIMSQENLVSPRESVEEMLQVTWQSVCDMYRSQCGSSMDDSCRVADYDAREGTLDANTGASDAEAGTTANVVALDQPTGRLAFLNCGDSRSFVAVGNDVLFKTMDHKPEREMERFRRAQESDPRCLYQTPECRFSRWFVPVGDYEYAVSRSLEGPFATDRGVISDADIHMVPAVPPGATVVCATDGLWEVCDTQEVCQHVQAMRFDHGMTAADIAKVVSCRAIEKGSTDNVSVVVVFLDEEQ